MKYLGCRKNSSTEHRHFTICLASALSVLLVSGACARGETKWAGVHPYPLWPSEPVPGWPGVGADDEFTVEKIQEKMPGKPGDPRPAIYGQPEFLAYPGAVHHLRHFLQRYVPPYPLNNHKTLVKNSILHEMPAYRGQCIEFAEPVYYNPMYGPRMLTKQKRPPVKVYPWEPGSAAIKLDLGELPRSVYAIRPIVAAPSVTQVVDQARKFVFFQLRINDLPGEPGTMNEHLLKACALDNFYAVTEFYFHSRGDGRTFRAEFELLPESGFDLLLYNIDVHDRLGEHARRRGKRKAVLDYMLPGDPEKRQDVWEKNRTADVRGHENAGKSNPDKTLAQQRESDDQVWRSLMPPLNCHYGGGWYCQRIDLDRLRICRAPDSWRRHLDLYDEKSGLFLDSTDGKLYLDGRRTFRASPPPYELRDMKVHRKLTREEVVDGQKKKVTELELVGPLSECEFTIGAGYWPHGPLKHKGKELGKIHEFAYQGRLYKDGAPVDEDLHASGVPCTRYFDETLKTPLLRELDVQPGLF